MAATSAKLPRGVNEQDDSDLKVEMMSVQSLEEKHGDLDEFAKHSRRKIREAKREQENELADRIANWRDKKGKQTVSRAEVSRHNRKTDAWVIVDGVAYDVTGFIDQHPGGPELLLKRAGQDVTQTFKDLGHSRLAGYILSEMYVGDLPLVERINFEEESGSEDEVSSDDDAKKNPVIDMRPKQEDTALESLSASVIQTPQLARLNRPVPNRYRRRVAAKGDAAKSQECADTVHASLASSSAHDSAERSSGCAEKRKDGERSEDPASDAAGGVSHAASYARSVPRPIPTTWQVLQYSLSNRAAARQLARDVSKALRHQVFIHRAQIIWSVGILVLSLVLWAIPLPPWLLGHEAPDGASIEEAGSIVGGVLSSDKLHDKVTARSDRSALHSAPPPGHDVGAVLYF